MQTINQHYYNRYIKFINSIPTTINDYTEVHHIIPKSAGGSNDSENLVELTARQHFIAHWLLYKAYKTDELIYAFWAMCHQKNKHQANRYNRINSRTYALLKQNRSRIISKTNSARWKDPVWAKQMSTTLSAAALTPEEKIRRSKNATEVNKKYKEQNSAKMKSLWNDPIWAEQMTNKFKKSNAKRRKALVINGVKYNHVSEAMAALNVSDGYIKSRIRSTDPKYKEWHYLS